MFSFVKRNSFLGAIAMTHLVGQIDTWSAGLLLVVPPPVGVDKSGKGAEGHQPSQDDFSDKNLEKKKKNARNKIG